MDIIKKQDKLKLIWKTKIQTLKFTKKDKEYYSFTTSFPVDLKKYIENIIGDQLEKIDFYSYDNYIIVGSSGSGIVETVEATAKLVEGEKNQLIYTVPKKIFKDLKPNTNLNVIYCLKFVEDVGDYLIIVSVE